MGNCVGCSCSTLTHENEIEDFYRLIFLNLKCRKFHFNEIMTEVAQMSSFNRNHLMEKFFYEKSRENCYMTFHSSLANIPNLGIDRLNEKELTLMILFSMSHDSREKLFWLKEAFGIKTFQEFWSYMDCYLYLNLYMFNSVINEELSSYENEIKIMDQKVDDGFKELSARLLYNVYDRRSIRDFSEDIKQLFENELLTNEEILSDSFWDEISRKYGYIFNFMDLRHKFYITRKDCFNDNYILI